MLANMICRYIIVLLSVCSNLMITPGLYITFPESGSTVSGIVEIRGSIPDTNFSSAKISYAYAATGGDNWFQIVELSEPMKDLVLAKWDTTIITDGTYRLKLSVATTNGTVNEVIVDQITVMNYTHVINTPQPNVEPVNAVTPEPTNESVDANQPTRIPENPAEADSDQLTSSMITGIVSATAILALLLIYSAIRGSRRRR